MVVAIIVLAVALVICITHIIRLNQDISNLSNILTTAIDEDTNMLLTTTTFSKNICRLSVLVNQVLKKQRRTLIHSKRSSREFKQAITNISHDLRTPLTSITGYVQMIKADTVSPESRTQYMNIIEERARYLSELINSLFEYTRIFEKKDAVNIERQNLCDVLRDTMLSYYQRFSDQYFDVVISIPDTPVYCLCDGNALERIFANLIENVLKHGAHYFELTFDIKTMTIVFKNKVADISKVDASRMFDRFYTADLSRNAKSTGLGLAIVKEYITQIGGSISAKIEKDTLGLYVKLAKNIRGSV